MHTPCLSIILAFLLLVLSSASSYATNLPCGPVDLRVSSLGPPRSQGPSSWCFAATAADLVSFELGYRVSVSDIAIHYLSSPKGIFEWTSRKISGIKDTGGGVTRDSILNLNHRGGFCREEDMPLTNQTIAEYLALRGEENGQPEQKSQACENESMRFRYRSDLFPKHNFCALLNDAMRTHFYSNEDLSLLSDFNCSPRQGLRPGSRVITRYDHNGDFLENIDVALNAGKPVAIAYRDRIWNYDPQTLHASVIVGRQPRGLKCFYLVRGTYGDKCDGVNAAFECLKDDPGNVWVDGGRLREMIYNLTWIY